MRVSKTDRLRAVLAGGGDLDALLASWESDVRASAVGAGAPSWSGSQHWA